MSLYDMIYDFFERTRGFDMGSEYMAKGIIEILKQYEENRWYR